MIKNLGERYSPLYFLAALGFGGMAVFFFMAFMHLTPHPGSLMPNFETIQDSFAQGDGFMKTVIVVAYIGMVAMLIVHFRLLVWNFREFNIFRGTDAYTKLRESNAEVTLMAIPLTLGMSVNGALVAAMALVPNLTSILQTLMPFALLAYGAVGVLALYFMSRYLKRIIGAGFDFKQNGGLNQLLSSFAFAMVSVGLAAPAAMADATWVTLAALLSSLFFASISVLLLLVFLPLGAMSMMRYGLSLQNSATLWLPIPMLTLWGITLLRNRHAIQGLHDLGPAGPQDHQTTSIWVMLWLAGIIMTQLTFLGLGHIVMKKNGFYKDYVFGKNVASPAAFTLVCPGVGISVVSMFFLRTGLIGNGLLTEGSFLFYAYLVGVAAIAAVTLWGALTIFRNQLSKNGALASLPEIEQADDVEQSEDADLLTVS